MLELGELVCARHLIPAGFDSAPYYRGLPDDMCPCEHWGYLARGKLRYRFADGDVRDVKAGDAFHNPGRPPRRRAGGCGADRVHPKRGLQAQGRASGAAIEAAALTAACCDHTRNDS